MARGHPLAPIPRHPFSPHTRGWPVDLVPVPLHPIVLPAHAGMARRRGLPWGRRHWFSPHTRGWPGVNHLRSLPIVRSPRTRGDGPIAFVALILSASFSPHTRGWPDNHDQESEGTMVLPAHAGMARHRTMRLSLRVAFSPHTRGWPVGSRRRGSSQRAFSPHTRGWPAADPEPVGLLLGSPRTRGDGPGEATKRKYLPAVLPAHAGMARSCPPCPR